MQKRVILCVDDEKIILSSLKSQLQHRFGLNYRIDLAESAEEALELVEEYIESNIEMPLVISDHIMGNMYGDELLSIIKQKLPSTLNILLTGQADTEAVGKAVNKASLFRFISKPWDEHDFLLTVETALNTYHQSKIIQLQNQYSQALATVSFYAMQPVPLKEQLHSILMTILRLPPFAKFNMGGLFVFASDFKLVILQNHEDCTPKHFETQLAEWRKLDNITQRKIQFMPFDIGNFYIIPLVFHESILGLMMLLVPFEHQNDSQFDEFLNSLSQMMAGLLQLDFYTQALKQQNELLEDKVEMRTLELKQALSKQKKVNGLLLKANQKLDRLATTDDLTGLLNRRQFFTQANLELARAKRSKHNMALMMIDIDYFKQVNDRFGHAAGDKVLSGVSHLLKQIHRSTDIVGRIGGEEFAVLLPDNKVDEARELAERLRTSVSNYSISVDGQDITVTISIGISEVLQAEIKIDDALKRADDALYSAKKAGRNLVF
jgi:diguanylate cyclase (GGDEF)-like protein